MSDTAIFALLLGNLLCLAGVANILLSDNWELTAWLFVMGGLTSFAGFLLPRSPR